MRKRLDAKKYTVTRQAKTEITEASSKTLMGPMELLDPPDLPPEWSLLIGDFAYNARAALDQLAWELAGSWTWRADKAKRARESWPPKNLYFPIYAYFPKPGDKKALKTKLSKFSPTHRKAIASVQPYKRKNLARAEPLWLLDRIRNDDAHRTLHTVLATVPFALVEKFRPTINIQTRREGISAASVGPPEGVKARRSPDIWLRPGDVLETTLKIEAKFSLYVTFDQRGADFHGQEVLPLLHRCRDEVERILGLFV